MKYYPCPCCGNLTYLEPTPGTYEICEVCHWQDDLVQYNNPNYARGANSISLNEAKKNYKKYGATHPQFLKDVRKPFPDEIPK